MNYTNLLNELEHASLFDLYRLRVAISKELDNPDKIRDLKRMLRIDMELSYFDYVKNKLVKTRVLELGRKRVLVLDLEQQKKFFMPYYMLNVDNIDTSIYEKTDNLTANNLSVGDCVGFRSSRDGRDIAGVIERLNRKTVSLITSSGSKWLVDYSYLHRIHDAEFAMAKPVQQLGED